MKALNRARRRLRKEYAELLAAPIENCGASPLLNEEGDIIDLFEWHVNIMSSSGALEGTPFHFIMKFPKNYPDRAPKVTPTTFIAHPNVFDDYICLDILTMSQETATTAYRGWTNAYTVSTILVQLQSFLFEVTPRQSACTRMLREARNFPCRKCGHNPKDNRNMFPEIPVQNLQKSSSVQFFRIGDQLRVIENFETHGRRHYETDNFVSIGTKLKVIGKTVKGKLKVERFPQPFKCERIIPVEYFDRIVPLKDYVSPEIEPQEMEDGYVSDDEDDHAYVWSSLGLYYFDVLPEEVLYVLLEFCSWDTTARISSMSESIGASMLKSKRLQMQSYRCFYTLQDATDKNCILGYGVQKKIMTKKSRVNRSKKDVLQQLHVSFDIMSYEAFHDAGVRNNIWKDRPVDAFLPLYINAEHGERAMTLSDTLLPKLLDDRILTADTILLTIGKAMNTAVVDMMLSVQDVETGELQMMDSIKALEGYMALHHTLLAYALKYPNLIARCEETVGRFMNDPASRDKEVTPDIGELLIALALTNYKWDEFVLAWVEEMMVRSVRWTLAKYPSLLDKEKTFSCVRLNRTYQATKTGKRLAMFQRFFIERIASPPELEGNPNKNKILFDRYNKNCGRPAVGLAEELQVHSRMVLNCDDWFNYFDLINFPAPTAFRLWNWLVNAMEISEGKRYHEESSILYWASSHLQDPGNDDHFHDRNCLCTGTVMNITKKKPHCSPAAPAVNLTQVGIKDSQKLDVAFCVDNTGSMRPWIRSARDQIRLIMKKLRASGKQVRFGFVGYTDHTAHNKAPLTRVVDFTKDYGTCQAAVDSWECTGNLDVPEALAPALVEVGGLSWDKTAQRICIIITDAPPHGIGHATVYDKHPKGDPDGSDVFVAAHTLGTAGVVLYPVHCTYYSTDAVEESLYRGLAQRTGGVYLKMSSKAAHCLSDIVLASSMEEDTLDDLGAQMKEYYDRVKLRHSIAREEQIIYQIHAAMKADNIRVTSQMMDEMEWDRSLQKQINDFAECMSIQQCQAIVKQDYFQKFPGQPKTNITSSTGLITKSQVARAYTRMNQLLATADVEKNGCVFRREKWQGAAFKDRQTEWLCGKSSAIRTKLSNFAPWKRLDSATFAEYTTIPNKRHYNRAPLLNGKPVGRKLRKFTNSKKITDLGKDKKPVAKIQCDWVKDTIVKAKRSFRILEVAIDCGQCYRVRMVSANRERFSIMKCDSNGRVFTIKLIHTEKFTVVSHPANTDVTPAVTVIPAPSEQPSNINLALDPPKEVVPVAEPLSANNVLTDVTQATVTMPSSVSNVSPTQYIFEYDFTNGPVRIVPTTYITLHPNILTQRLIPTSAVVCQLPVNMTIVVDALFKHRAHMISPFQGWFWLRSPTQELVVPTNIQQSTPVFSPVISRPSSPTPVPVINQQVTLASVTSIAEFVDALRPNQRKSNSDSPTAAVLEPRSSSILTESGCSTNEEPECDSVLQGKDLRSQFQTPALDATLQPPLDFSHGPVAVSKRYLTLQRCVVRSHLHPYSTKIGNLDTGAMIVVDAIFRQRAHMTSPLEGWFWLSTPQKLLVQEVELAPSQQAVISAAFEPVSKEVIIPPVTVEKEPQEDVPIVVVRDFDSTQASDLMHRLNFIMNVQAHSVRVVNEHTFEFQVNTHTDGETAINWHPMIRGKKIKMEWKSEYVNCRRNITSV